MHNVASVLTFGWAYLSRYKGRIALGVLLALLFGLANGSFVWATRTIIGRFEPAPTSAPAPAGVAGGGGAVRPEGALGSLKVRLQEVHTRVQAALEPWLPRLGRPLNWRQVVGGLLFIPILLFVRAATDYLSNYCIGWVSERTVRDLRLDLMGKLSMLSLDFFARFTTGDLLTRINADSANLLRALRVGGADLIKEPLTLAVVLAMLIAMDWKLTFCALVLLPACLLPLLILGRKARRATRAGLKASVSQSSQLVELLASIRVVKAFGLEGEQLARFRRTSADLVHAGMKGVMAKELVNPIIEVVCALGLGLLLLYVFVTGRTGADLATFLAGLVMLFQPIKKLAGIHVLFEQAGVGVVRLQEMLAEQPTVRDPAQPRPVAPFARDIVFERVTFSYREHPVLHRPVLQDLHLVIPRGFRLGLAGESGSGKTTILNLLFRFYDPTAGSIRLDGLDLREMAMADLRQQMALVSQESVIFDQTVAANIGCGRAGATREEIEAAARAAFAHEFIQELPHGYDTRLGERGTTLSGGQRQRLCIARAFVRNAPILVLDEATASLDSKAEAEVQAAIDRLAEHRTVICVAHRLSTLAAMDRILVLDAGRVMEQGNFQELLQARGAFAAMAARQGIFPAS